MTLQLILDDIRYRLNQMEDGVAVTDFWSDTELTTWANEAQDNLTQRLPLEMLKGLAATYLLTISVNGRADLPASFIRAKGVEIGDEPCVVKGIEERYCLRNNEFYKTSTSPRHYIVWQDYIEFLPSPGAGQASLFYIKAPTAMSAPATDSPDLPSHLHHLIVLYATARAKRKQEEHQVAEGLMAEYTRFIAELKNIYEMEKEEAEKEPKVKLPFQPRREE